MNNDTIKLAHENFVTGHDGSNPIDVLLTVFPVIPGTFAAMLLTDGQQNLCNFGVQYILCVLPMILSFTIMSCSIISINLGMFLIAGASWAYIRNKRGICKTAENNIKSSRLPYLTCCRSAVLICTVIAILGVDFHCFPRRFAKTEFYGYSLMDIGASCFVFIHGLFDRLKKRGNRHLLSIGVLLLLGFLRLLSVRATNYQHHVTEYGVHANFFFTLAVLKLLCCWWIQILTTFGGIILSVGILLFHQLILASGLAEWTMSDASRGTIVSANREFLVSIPGFVVIYVLGSVTASLIEVRQRELNFRDSLPLVGVTLGTASVLLLLELIGMPPSRRLANPSFVLWTILFVLFFLTMFKNVEIAAARISGRRFTPVLFDCANANGLLFFLAANLLTGFVNFAVDTMTVAFPADFAVINAYVLSLLLPFYLLFSMANQKRPTG